MDQENAQTPGTSITSLGRKSWTAYLGVIFLGLVLLLLLVPLAWQLSAGFGMIVFALVSAFLAYKILTINSCHLYCDDSGVWVYSGILPWKKGVQGVKWRDLDEAVYFQNMGSWLFKSYSLRIGHRFTKSSEVLLSHIARGDQSVIAINTQHRELVRQNRLN